MRPGPPANGDSPARGRADLQDVSTSANTSEIHKQRLFSERKCSKEFVRLPAIQFWCEGPTVQQQCEKLLFFLFLFFFLRRTTEPMQKTTNQTKTPQKTFALHTENLKIFKAVRNCEGEKVVKSKMFLDCWLWLCLKCLLIFCLNISQYKLYGRGSQGRDLMLDLGYGSTRS